jgi:hypothetical protein
MGFLTELAQKYFSADGDDKGAPAVQDVSDQPIEDIQLAAFIKRKVEEVRSSANRISHEGIWMTNIAYALGYDSVYYDTAARQYKPVGSPFKYPARNRTHDNQILPAMQNRLARLCKNPPRWETRPEDDTPEAKESAALDYDVALDLWERLGLDEKDIELKMWLQQCGHAYLVAAWDEDAGEDLVDPVTGEFLGFTGDTTAEVASAFEFFADPKAKTLRDAKWVVRAKVRELEYFRDRFPRGGLVKEEGAWLLSTQYELRINALNAAGPQSAGTQEAMKNCAIELAYYEKRSKKFPRGRHCITANGVLLENKELPIGRYPFEKFDDIKISGKYYPEAAVTHARPLQDQYNRNLARTSEWVNKLTGGKWRAAKGHGLSEEALNDRTEVVEYNALPNAPPPEAMQVPVIPAHIYKEREDLKSGLYEKFGLSEVSRGHMPSAGIPAVGMQLLVEQDETRISIEVRSHENCWAEFMNILLEYEGAFRKMPRRLKKKSDMGYSIRSYTGDMLSKKPDVRIVRGSTIPQSRSLRRQEIINSWQAGLLGNPADPVLRQTVWAAIENGDTPEIWKDVRLDKAQISGVIDKLLDGETPSFNKLDNHALHVYLLNEFRKEREKDLSPEQLSMVEYLIDRHAQAATEFADPALSAKLENVQNGLMPDGSGPDQIMEAQVRGAAVGEANDAAFHASQPAPMPQPGVPV